MSNEHFSDSPPGAASPRSRSSFDLYAEVTQKIITMLEKGVVPWRSPIMGAGQAGMPKNLSSGKAYRGVNIFLLALTSYVKGYDSAYWLTYRQAQERGGHVRKNEKGSMVVFWKQLEVQDKETQELKRIPLLRHYTVFNVRQCEGIEAPDPAKFTPSVFEANAAADAIVQGYAGGPVIEHDGTRAFYRPKEDKVYMPAPERFTHTSEYYSTLFHELSHSTGAKHRLDRGLSDKLAPFGSPDYGKEELIAEMSAAFLSAEAGLERSTVIENQAAYISGWLGTIKADKKLVVWAAAAGQKAADWIRGRRFDVEEHHDDHDPSPKPSTTVAPKPEQPSAGSTSNSPQISEIASERTHQLIAAATDYHRRGFAVVPIPMGQKGPILHDWQRLRLSEEQLPDAFNDQARGGNIGLILGEPSGHLVDVDLDCPEARELADRFLPPTEAITGRPSSPRSHRWYRCPDVQSRRHQDPVTHASIIEIRSTGGQTLVGPSIHPSGEPYDRLVDEPAQIAPDALSEAVKALAQEVIRLRHGNEAIEKLNESPTTNASQHRALPGGHLDDDAILKRAETYLGKIPGAISGQGGHNRTYTAATALVHGFGLSHEQALRLLMTQYNSRCDPPWSEQELRHKIADAANKPHLKPFGWLLGAPPTP